MAVRGYCGIGMVQYSHEVNIGTLFRSACFFGASFVFTIGRKYKKQAADTCDSINLIPYYNYVDYYDFKNHLPKGCRIVCVELSDKARNLKTFVHPDNAVYLLGNEVTGIPSEYMQCPSNLVVQIPSNCGFPLNVSACGTAILYDRASKRNEI